MYYAPMVERITLSPVNETPSGSRVYHYDELPERTKEYLPCLIETDERDVAAPEQVRNTLESYEVIKFTDYYRITIRHEASGP